MRLSPARERCCRLSPCHSASAHASLFPPYRPTAASVVKAPKSVELHFNESVTPAVMSLIDATGRSRGDAAVPSSDPIIILPADLPNGTHRQLPRDLRGRPPGRWIDVFSIGAVTGKAPPAKAGRRGS